jgi:hypothetical protein
MTRSGCKSGSAAVAVRPQSSTPAAPASAKYASAQPTHFGARSRATPAAPHRVERRQVQRSGLGGRNDFITVVVAKPLHAVLESLFVPTLGHDVENPVRSHQHLHPATVG